MFCKLITSKCPFCVFASVLIDVENHIEELRNDNGECCVKPRSFLSQFRSMSFLEVAVSVTVVMKIHKRERVMYHMCADYECSESLEGNV